MPATIQRRLVAFLLRRLIGRFVSNETLDDASRVEADLGRGSIVLNRLELDAEARRPILRVARC